MTRIFKIFNYPMKIYNVTKHSVYVIPLGIIVITKPKKKNVKRFGKNLVNLTLDILSFTHANLDIVYLILYVTSFGIIDL